MKIALLGFDVLRLLLELTHLHPTVFVTSVLNVKLRAWYFDIH